MVVVVEGGDEELHATIRLRQGWRNVVDDRIEERLKVDWGFVEAVDCCTVAADGVEGGEVKLVGVGCEFEEEVLYLTEDFGDTRRGTINLIDDDNEA